MKAPKCVAAGTSSSSNLLQPHVELFIHEVPRTVFVHPDLALTRLPSLEAMARCLCAFALLASAAAVADEAFAR